MKTTLILLLSAFSLSVTAQTKTHTDIKKSIHDDGKKLTISINGTQNGKQVYYDKTFNVASLSKLQKDALVKGITDSLGVPQQPAPPVPPAPPTMRE